MKRSWRKMMKVEGRPGVVMGSWVHLASAVEVYEDCRVQRALDAPGLISPPGRPEIPRAGQARGSPAGRRWREVPDPGERPGESGQPNQVGKWWRAEERRTKATEGTA